MRQETAQFILSVVKYTWVRELRNTDTLYTNVEPKALLAHLQAGCMGRHALDLMVLHNEMQRYHPEVEETPKYINMIKDAKNQAGIPGSTISNETLYFPVQQCSPWKDTYE